MGLSDSEETHQSLLLVPCSIAFSVTCTDVSYIPEIYLKIFLGFPAPHSGIPPLVRFCSTQLPSLHITDFFQREDLEIQTWREPSMYNF